MQRFNINKYNGRFTVRSEKTGRHRTFRITSSKDENGNITRWVKLLTGPDNTSSYTSFARIVNDRVVVFYKHKGTQWELLATMLNKMQEQGLEETKAQILEAEVKCRRCSRPLTTPESLQRGLGPECATKA